MNSCSVVVAARPGGNHRADPGTSRHHLQDTRGLTCHGRHRYEMRRASRPASSNIPNDTRRCPCVAGLLAKLDRAIRKVGPLNTADYQSSRTSCDRSSSGTSSIETTMVPSSLTVDSCIIIPKPLLLAGSLKSMWTSDGRAHIAPVSGSTIRKPGRPPKSRLPKYQPANPCFMGFFTVCPSCCASTVMSAAWKNPRPRLSVALNGVVPRWITCPFADSTSTGTPDGEEVNCTVPELPSKNTCTPTEGK